MVTHIGKNIHKKYFTTIINLNRYLLTHPRKKPYPCELCDKTFLRNYDWLFILLKNHKYVHFLFPYKLVYFY